MHTHTHTQNKPVRKTQEEDGAPIRDKTTPEPCPPRPLVSSLEGVSVGGRCGVPCPPNPELNRETPWLQLA